MIGRNVTLVCVFLRVHTGMLVYGQALLNACLRAYAHTGKSVCALTCANTNIGLFASVRVL